MTAYAVTGQSAGFGGLGPWRYRTEIVDPPASGQLRFDNADPSLATTLWIHDTNDDSVDMSNFLNLLTIGSLIYIQDQADALNYIVVEITSTTDQGVYVEFGITTSVVAGTVPSQNSKVSVVVGQSGAGQTTLQGAYNNSLGANPMILLDAVPTPITIRASVAGSIFEVQDVGNANTIFEVMGNPDTITARAAVTIEDPFLNAAAANSLVFSDTFTTGGGFLGGAILSNGTVTYNNSFFIWALLQESKTYNAAAGPGFAAFTLFNALAIIQNSGNFDLVQALILNNGLSHRRTTSGTSSVTQTIGLSNSPNTRTNVSGAVMTKSTGDTAVRHAPTFASVTGSTVNMGTQRGLWCVNPLVALFQTQTGVENMTAYIGVEIDAIPFGGNVTKRGIRSALTAATNTRFIDGTGTAQSDLRGNLNFPADLVGNVYGASNDWFESWAAGGFKIEQQQSPNPVAQYRKSFPTTTRMLKDWSVDMEMTVNCALGFSLGAQSGANGNQFGNFVAGAQSVTVGGEYSQFLLTQAGNVTADAALGGVFGWTINAPSITLGTGTVTTAGALNVGGNVNQGSVNRFGVRILSNPSGGSGVNAALWVTAGLTRLDGRLDINQPIALGGGAVATLGTIGGTGPTAAAQAQWVEIDINGVAHWIPAWT